MLKKLTIGVAAALGMLLLTATATSAGHEKNFSKVQVGDTLFVNGYCVTEEAAMGLYWQISQRSPTIPLEQPADCVPDKKAVVVGKVLSQAPSVRTSTAEVVMVKVDGEDDRWYIGFSNNIQPAPQSMGIPPYTPAATHEDDSPVGWMAGELLVLSAYCNSTDEQLVRDMSDAVLRKGWKGYVEWLNEKNPCYDARFVQHYAAGVRPVRGTLLEKLWTVDAGEEVFEVWRFADGALRKRKE